VRFGEGLAGAISRGAGWAPVPALAAPGIEIIQNDRHFSLATIKVKLGTTVRSEQDESPSHRGDTRLCVDSGEQPRGSRSRSPSTGAALRRNCAIHRKCTCSSRSITERAAGRCVSIGLERLGTVPPVAEIRRPFLVLCTVVKADGAKTRSS